MPSAAASRGTRAQRTTSKPSSRRETHEPPRLARDHRKRRHPVRARRHPLDDAQHVTNHRTPCSTNCTTCYSARSPSRLASSSRCSRSLSTGAETTTSLPSLRRFSKRRSPPQPAGNAIRRAFYCHPTRPSRSLQRGPASGRVGEPGRKGVRLDFFLISHASEREGGGGGLCP